MMKKFAENPHLEDEENDENFDSLLGNNHTDTDRPASSEAHSSGSSDLPPPPTNKVKKTPAAPKIQTSGPTSRGATGFNSVNKVGGAHKKSFGSPRKIYDNKSHPNSRQQQSPTHTNSTLTSHRARSARSPIHNGVNSSSRLSANLSDRNTSPANRNRAHSPKPPSSPLLTPRNATSADVRLNSANKPRKKKATLSATMPK